MKNPHTAPRAREPIPSEWETYRDLQTLADSPRLNDKSWAVDDVLDEHLIAKAKGLLHPDPETRQRTADNRITNRRKIHARRRQILLDGYAATTTQTTATADRPDSRAERRERLAAIREQASRFEWFLLRCLARGRDYKRLAVRTRTSIGTLKSVVSRCRVRLRLGSEPDAVVNPERGIKRRVREFDAVAFDDRVQPSRLRALPA